MIADDWLLVQTSLDMTEMNKWLPPAQEAVPVSPSRNKKKETIMTLFGALVCISHGTITRCAAPNV